MTCHMPINWATRYKSYPVETNFPTWEKWFRTLTIQPQNWTDDEDEDYTDYVQTTGDNLEETLGKIVEYIKSGKHYSDGRYL